MQLTLFFCFNEDTCFIDIVIELTGLFPIRSNTVNTSFFSSIKSMKIREFILRKSQIFYNFTFYNFIKNTKIYFVILSRSHVLNIRELLHKK